VRAGNRRSSTSPAAFWLSKQISMAQLMQRTLPILFFFGCL